MGRISNALNSNNQILLECSGLNSDDIEIIWYAELSKPKTIIYKGKKVGKIGYEYGPNKFVVRLNNNLISSFSHFKTNNWHSHNYSFTLNKTNNSLSIKFLACGPDQSELNKTVKIQ